MNAGNRPPSKQQYAYVCSVAQLCPTICNPKDCSLPGSSVHGILQARILEWVIMPFNRRFSWPREWTWVSCIIGGFSTVWGTREALLAVEMPDIFISWYRYLQIPFMLITALKSWKLFIICWILLHCAVLSRLLLDCVTKSVFSHVLVIVFQYIWFPVLCIEKHYSEKEATDLPTTRQGH